MRWSWIVMPFLMGCTLTHAQEDTLKFVAPEASSIQGTVDVEVKGPADTTSVRFDVDGTQTSELTNEYALATKTPVLWRTVIASEWFAPGKHVLHATAVTARGTLTVSRSVLFEGKRSELSLNGGWRFASADELPFGKMEGAAPAVTQPSFVDAGWKLVLVPNSIDAINGAWMRHEGLLGTYRRSFHVPQAQQEQMYLHAESCFWTCRYFVNGKEVATESGGYLPRRINITQAVHAGENSLAVIVDSRATTMGAFNRLRYYYWNYTGLLQDISLEQMRAATVAEFRAQGTADGTLTLYPQAVNTTGKQQFVQATVRVLDDSDGHVVFTGSAPLQIAGIDAAVAPVLFHLSGIKQWDLDHPHLYTVEMKVGGRLLTEKTGFRDVTVQHGDLLLNGKPVLGLQGFDRHGDFPGLGKSQPDGLADREIKLLHDRGYRIFRPAHYPTTKAELDAADKYGMLVLEEINVTGMSGDQLKSAEVIHFAHVQLKRLIERDRSHPSIFAWSIGNENRTDQPGSPIYVHDVIGYGKSLDSSRPFTEVSAQLRNDICYADMDFLAVNIYAGWYTDKLEDVVTELDALEKYAPHKPVVITEYGTEAVPGRRGLGKGSEYFQALTIDMHNRLLRDRPHFIGKMYWTSTEFIVGPKWDGGNPNPVPPYHTKGVLDYYRRPKLGWRVMFSPADLELVTPIGIPNSSAATQRVKLLLRNRTSRSLAGNFVIEAPVGAVTSFTQQHFELPANGSTTLEFDLTQREVVKRPNPYGLVHAVFDDGTEAMPQVLQWPVASASVH